MSSKKELKYSINKKVVRDSLEKAAAVRKAFMRDSLEPLELTVIHPGQMNFDAELFPTFCSEVSS